MLDLDPPLLAVATLATDGRRSSSLSRSTLRGNDGDSVRLSLESSKKLSPKALVGMPGEPLVLIHEVTGFCGEVAVGGLWLICGIRPPEVSRTARSRR